jgi:hypothetical protein
MARIDHFVWSMTAATFLLAPYAAAYPEFEQYIDQTSGRYVNCSMCHTHPEGPEGVKPGQIGSLNAEQMDQLNRGRAAFEPGMGIENPILNAFGNSIVEQLGKTEFLQMRLRPKDLSGALDPTIDTDGDGISDADELRAGTLPTDHNHGDPWRLFLHNLRERAFHVLMLVVATALGLYGIRALLHGFEARMRQLEADDEQTY